MKVSVITATWNRHHILPRAMRSLAAQTFTDWENIIISDGRDDKLKEVVEKTVAEINKPYNYRIVELGRNWHQLSGRVNYGGIPKMVGTYLAEGQYIAYLDDDNEYYPNHLTDLVAKIEEGYDFVYGISEIVTQDQKLEMYLGDGNPRFCHIDTSMVLHRWELIQKANWKGNIHADDWELFESWLRSGAKCGWVDKITLRYYRKY